MTLTEIFKKGMAGGLANSVLIKLNQIGTVKLLNASKCGCLEGCEEASVDADRSLGLLRRFREATCRCRRGPVLGRER